ncbi:Uncharacterised protein [Mycobacterium tuberculosis]|uniref:Uncharacterized protein n=1 Tax=Mycobacterium tuberculosis TaxID=1773 RepID=A0A0U0QU94_MYCTX|nr:Uncharacterised protein [Mycobacterium tuberculosis]COW12287.1 Uncharacterised protein [Mycobacterium tuberculosis]
MFVRAHQPQLVVLPVQSKQLVRETAQRFGGYTAAAEVGARRSIATDRAQRDHAAVLVALGPRRVENRLQPRDGRVVEIGCSKTPFDNGTVSTGPNASCIGPGTTK